MFGGIKGTRMFASFPLSTQKLMRTEKYWDAIEQSHFFRKLDPAFRRAVAYAMQSEIYCQGEVIYWQGKNNHRMVYIARGRVLILSGNDDESPLVTLEAGTCIGETCLLLNVKSPCQVVAASSCLIYSLKMDKLWKSSWQYRKLDQNRRMHRIMAVGFSP